MQRIALFPGTFDPITIGHLDIINRALPLFDKLVIGIGRNINKTPMFSDEQRISWIEEIYKDMPKVSAVLYEGLTVECCQKVGANFIVRGIRYVNDFEYEKAIADMNRSLDNNIETIFLTCLPQFTSVASTLVRDVLRNGGDVMKFLPDVVARTLEQRKKYEI
ncbi:pantetheine-phosphate adenylyltransferase [Pseudoflavitalea sp. X16]|jgi:pantetheine-phosphate adenylyltransferase|uniref:pantetheine-phosphate adenylyltransferase n=1 Tax=Paraflavitalea devenefica TaxID=2716334 RepID=UPI0014201DC8|nr:pantetheine-phosphate adenylyltransferase [Paraflavitalea devenefica]NII28070.1 pantetheine-phosphate adenylyltransferase [Paraflavitalea devenefica]